MSFNMDRVETIVKEMVIRYPNQNAERYFAKLKLQWETADAKEKASLFLRLIWELEDADDEDCDVPQEMLDILESLKP